MKLALHAYLAALALTASMQASPASNPEPARQSNESRLLQRHLDAFVRNDLDAVVSDYAPDAVLVGPDGTYRGTARIRRFFETLMRQFPQGASTLELDRTVFTGDLVHFVWHATTPTLSVPFATDTMIVRRGKIVRQTFAGQLRPLQIAAHPPRPGAAADRHPSAGAS